MSVTSCVRHPAGARFLKIHEWQLEYCDGNQCAAALLSYFEFVHNWKLEQREQARKKNDALEAEGKPRTQDETLLQWHTAKELEAAVMLFKRDTIQRAVDNVLVPKGAVEVMKNPNPRQRFDHTKHFLFKPKALNEWLNARHPEPAQSIDEKSEIVGGKPVFPTIEEKSEIDTDKSSIGSDKSSFSNKEYDQRRQTKETTTKGRTPSRYAAPAPKQKRRRRSSLSDEEEAEAVRLAEKFGARQDSKQADALREHIRKCGLGYVQEKEKIAECRPPKHRNGAFWAALEADWPKPTEPEKPSKKKTDPDPDGWRTWIRLRYPDADPTLSWREICTLMPDVRKQFLAEHQQLESAAV